MMRKLLGLAFALLLPALSAAQAPPANEQEAASPAAPASPALEPQGYTYSPDGRRDPFVSLSRRGSDAQGSAAGMRPAGLGGLTVGEVSLKGTLASRNGLLALLQGVDAKTYIVRPGDRLLDGTVRTIMPDAVVILQQVNDPLSLEKERDVRKVLRQTEEVR